MPKFTENQYVDALVCGGLEVTSSIITDLVRMVLKHEVEIQRLNEESKNVKVEEEKYFTPATGLRLREKETGRVCRFVRLALSSELWFLNESSNLFFKVLPHYTYPKEIWEKVKD